MRTRFGLAVLLASTLAWTACKSSSSSTPTISGVVVSGNGSFTAKNATSQLTATANKSDGTSENVSNVATWASNNNGIATVTSAGLVTSVGNGTAQVTATYQGQSGALAVLVTLRATATLTPTFKRLCSPFRAGIDIVVAETGNSIGYDLTAMTIRFRDLSGNVKVTKTYNATELAAALGGSAHINAGGSKIMTFESQYTPVVETMDSSASVEATGTDDAGNAITINLPSIRQSDRC